MIGDYDDDTHFCLKCHITIIGLDNYVSHRKTGCSKNLGESPKSPLPSQLLPPDESFGLKADDFFSSLELRSSSKKPSAQSTSGKNFSGILTRSKTTAVIQATSGGNKDTGEIQQSKSGKNVWIGGHQLKELGYGDNQSKLIKAVADLERRKEEPGRGSPRVPVYEESDEESEEYDYDVDYSSDEDQDVPPRNYTGGKWKPSSPIQWSRSTDRDWNVPPPTHTGGKWKPSTKRSSSPPVTHTKGKWKPSYNPQKEDYDAPPPTFTGSKWVSSKKECQDVPPPTHTKGKWKPKLDDEDFPPPNHTKGKWKPKSQIEEDSPPPTHTKGKWKPKGCLEEDIPPPSHTKGKWKPRNDEDDFPPPSHTKGKWKPRNDNEEDFPPPSHTKGKWKPRNDSEDDFPPPTHTKGKWKPKNDTYDAFPSSSHTKDKWKSQKDTEMDLMLPSTSKIKDNEVNRSSTGKECKKQFDPKPTCGDNKEKWDQSQTKLEDNYYNKGKWMPGTPNKDPLKISNDTVLRESSGAVQYWCNPCNRKLASKVVYERHLKSELHFKRTLHDREFDDTDELSLLKDARRQKIKPPEPIFSGQEKAVAAMPKKRNRKKIYLRCEVCQSKVNRYLIGKHLISHYHCRKGDITTPVARNMVLENIGGIVLQSPFQCSVCKFYCNTHSDFLRHWLSSDHVNRNMPGYFLCSFCKFKSEETTIMYDHLVSQEHNEVVSVINRSVPIVIKKINPIHCLTCNKEFLLNMQLLDHCRRCNHDDSNAIRCKSEFVCSTCQEGFVSSVALQRHQQNVHKEKYFICTPCNLKFDNAEKAKLHRKSLQHKYSCLSKSGDGKAKRKCEYCEETFANFLLLKEHLKEKHPEHRIRCPHCGADFTITQELTIHLRSKSCKFEENPNNSFRCEKCPFSSNSTSELIFHIALHDEPLMTYPDDKEGDPKVKPICRYKCPICEKIFPKSSLQAHIRLHTKERPFECKICGAKFARKNNLQFHVKNHEKKEVRREIKAVSGERPFLCSMCGASFKKKSILQQHTQIHTGKLCKCPKLGCVYSARKISEIKEHLKTHSDVRNFMCALCDYRGKTKQQLNRHMSVHDETKKYNCPQCSFTTRTSTHLRRHSRLHTGAKPFSCPHCKYKCNTLENLRKHVLSTNKHPGKCIYECKFCTEDHFHSNFAKEFKAHLVTGHSKMFGSGAEAATYVAGIYDVHDDKTYLNDIADIQEHERNLVSPTPKIDDANENILHLETDEDPIVSQLSTNLPSTSGCPKNRTLDQMLPMFIIPKDEVAVIVENSHETWNLVGRYDVEEESGTLIPFQSDGESIFQEHFQ